MKYATFTFSALLLCACASHQGEVLETTTQLDAVDASQAVTQVLSVSVDELDNGRICEFQTLPGSRIAYRHCYTREQQAANQAARDELVQERMEDLRRMQANRERYERERWEAQERALMYQAGQDH